jgi:hypothetical protein
MRLDRTVSASKVQASIDSKHCKEPDMNPTIKSIKPITQTAAAVGLAASITLSILAGLNTLAAQHHAAASLAAAAASTTQAAVAPHRAPRG